MNADEALVRAASASDEAGVKDALAQGGDPDVPDATGRPLFASIVSWATPEILRLFLAAGASTPRDPTADGWTFAHAAVTRGDAELLAELARRGVALDTRWERSLMTPLETAAWYGHATCVEVLLDAGVSPAASDAELPSALSRASLRGHEAIVELLTGRGARPREEKASPWPPRDWDDVPGWDRFFRFAIARTRGSTQDLLPMADVAILRELWRPRGAKRRVLVLGAGISFLPRLLALGGDDVVAIDRSPVAVEFARENKIHRSLVEWFFSTIDDRKELAPARGDCRWEVGDTRTGSVVAGPFDHVVATALLHGFDETDQARIVANAAGWCTEEGELHVGLYGGALVAERVRAIAADKGARLRLWCFG